MLQKSCIFVSRDKKMCFFLFSSHFLFTFAEKHTVMMKRFLFFLFVALAGWMTVGAKVQLPQLFQSGMVLQRNQPIPVWGKADACEQVTITFRKKAYTTTADAKGCWRIDLPKQKAGGPFTLSVVGGSATDDAITLTDVLVGDV